MAARGGYKNQEVSSKVFKIVFLKFKSRLHYNIANSIQVVV